MMPDRRGEMGFMEAMVCTIAVCIVLNAFIAFSAADSIPEDSPLGSFDADSVHIDFTERIEVDDEYLARFMISENLFGISISVTVPYFAEEPTIVSVGEQRGLLYRDSYILMADYDNGRHVPIVVEVSAYA